MLKDPFFIVGFPRSGTTLLASMLGRHKDIFVPAETHFFRFYMYDTQPMASVEAEVERFCSYSRIRDLGLHPHDFSGFLDLIEADRVNLLTVALHVLAMREKKDVYGEKTPAHMLFLKAINRSYPDARIIAIVRDGRDCVLSNIKESWTRNDPYRLAAEWRFYDLLLRLFFKKNKNRVLTIRYEDLVIRPEGVLFEITEFLGLPEDGAMLGRAASTSVVPDWERAWKAKALGLPDGSGTYKWKENKSLDMLNDVTWLMRDGLLRHGYDCDPKRIDISILIRKFMFLPVPYATARITLGAIRKIKRKLKGFFVLPDQ